MPSQDIIVNNHRGIVNQAAFAFQERQPPEFARYASDVVFDLQGNVHVAWGFQPLANTGVVTTASVSCGYYSTTLLQNIVLDGTTLKQLDPITGALLHSNAAAFISGSQLSFAEWPQLNSLFISDGTSYKELKSDGTLTDRTGAAPLGAGRLIITHKARIWSVGPSGLSQVEIVPSDNNAPTTFNSNNALRASEDGPQINALSSNQNLLFLHKDATIYAIGGRDVDTFVIKNLRVGRGAIGPYAIYSKDKIDYLITKDGIGRFNVDMVDPLQKFLSGLMRPKVEIADQTVGIGSAFDTKSIVTALVPLWGPDYGRQYILFFIKYTTGFSDELWRYDVDNQDFVQLCANNQFTFRSLWYAPDKIKTFFVEDSSTGIQRFSYSDKYNTDTITGVYETQAIDGGARNLCKTFNAFNQFPILPGTSVLVDLDGANIFPYNLTDTTQTQFDNENLGKAYLANLLFRRQGGTSPMCGGFSVQAAPIGNNRDRSFASSRKDNIVNGMTNGTKPYILSVTTLAGGETSITVTHNLGYLPQAIIATHEGYTSNKTLTVSNVTTTTCQINLQAAGTAGKKINVFILRRGPISFLDSHLNGGKLTLPSGGTSLVIPHQFPGSPQIYTSVVSSGAGSSIGIVTSVQDGINIKFVPSAACTFYWVALLSGTDPWYKSAAVSASPVTHGLGSTPSLTLLYPNQSSVPTHGLTSESSTQLVYSGAGNYNTAVFQ